LPQNREVKKAVGAWIQSLIIPRIEQLKKQALARGEVVEADPPPTTLHTITELQDMLSEQLDSWERRVANQALLLGEKQGLERGLQLGEQRGIQLGELRGMQLGEERGIQLGEQRGIQLGEQRGLRLGEQRGIQLGEQRGKVEGLLQGKFEAQSYTLRRLLSRRFGVLSPDVSAQIAAADISQIETWLDRVLDASSVDDVLKNH
jgi:flagellar biosynthesis/type III secretory pathway protein FliH